MSDLSFVWRGQSTDDLGVCVKRLPPITTPQRRDEEHVVPGRSGSLHTQDGAWNEMLMPVECYLPYEQDTTVAELRDIRAWLTGYDWVTFSNNASRKFRARIINTIQFSDWVVGFEDKLFTVVFNCDPHAYYIDAPEVVLTASGGFLTNPGTSDSKPVITIAGSGDITLMVGLQIVELTGVDGSITIDSALGETYKGSVSENNKMAGDYPLLLPGANAISWTGTVSSVTIAPNWRDI